MRYVWKYGTCSYHSISSTILRKELWLQDRGDGRMLAKGFVLTAQTLTHPASACMSSYLSTDPYLSKSDFQWCLWFFCLAIYWVSFGNTVKPNSTTVFFVILLTRIWSLSHFCLDSGGGTINLRSTVLSSTAVLATLLPDFTNQLHGQMSLQCSALTVCLLPDYICQLSGIRHPCKCCQR